VNRSAAARIAVYESWARTPDRSARTSAARTGLLAKFEREARERLGPGASDRAVAEAAEAAKAAHYRRMSAASARKRWGTPAPPNPGQAPPTRKQAS
jgi:hypothetical protein